MRISFLTFTAVALVASTMTAASAFNYAQLSARTVAATIVQDDGAYLSLDHHDADYDCYVEFAADGKISVTWDGGTSCGAGGGTGINAGSTYHYHDVLVVTNKGTKTLSNLWFNMTDTVITIQTATSAGAMTTGGTYSAAATATSIAPGSSVYLGFKIDASTLDTSDSPLSKSLTVEARSST